MNELLDKIAWMRDLTGRPVGVKTAIGGWRFMNELAEAVHRRGLEFAPDFLVIDGGEGGSGAAPQALADHMGLSIDEALPRVVDALIETGLRQRIRVDRLGQDRHLGARRLGAVRRRRFHQHRARLHVLARLHPGAALPPEHLPDRRHHAQQAPAARAGGGGEIPARRQLRNEHEPRDRHDRALLRRAARARAAGASTCASCRRAASRSRSTCSTRTRSRRRGCGWPD